jgi:hypothetical protein
MRRDLILKLEISPLHLSSFANLRFPAFQSSHRSESNETYHCEWRARVAADMSIAVPQLLPHGHNTTLRAEYIEPYMMKVIRDFTESNETTVR